MKEPDFDFLSTYVESKAGIVLAKDKMYLIESRLSPVIKSEGLKSIDELVMRLRWKSTPELESKVIDVMTTNETFFFRDDPPFEALRVEVIKTLMDKRADTKKLTIWSAASSSGQEAYSILILLKENFPGLHDWNVEVLGTDVSDEILEKAQQGIYSEFEVSRGLNTELVRRYFEPVGNRFRIRESIRNHVRFEKLNLMDSFAQVPRMDIIFLRNVLIYFKAEVKKNILSRMHPVLKPDGYLFLGQSETVKMLDDSFVPVNIASASCFQSKNSVVTAG